MTATRRTYRMGARAQDVTDTRERILEGARELFLARSFEEVTLQDLAAAAGVTRQTVLNHFDSKDGVFLAAAATVAGWRAGTSADDLDGALDALVTEYEQVGDTLVRLLAVEERFSAVRTQLERGRRGHRDWVTATFRAHLPPAGAARTAGVLALVAATDVYVWKLLRRDLGRSRAVTRRVIGTLVAGTIARLDDEAQEAP